MTKKAGASLTLPFLRSSDDLALIVSCGSIRNPGAGHLNAYKFYGFLDFIFIITSA